MIKFALVLVKTYKINSLSSRESLVEVYRKRTNSKDIEFPCYTLVYILDKDTNSQPVKN